VLICPAGPARRENCRFFATAAAACLGVGERPLHRRWLGAAGEVEIEHRPEARSLEATIRLDDIVALPRIVARLRRLFDLGADLATIGAQLARDPLLAPLIAARPGVRLPGGWDSDAPPDEFPASDPQLLRGALHLERLTPSALLRRAERWRPWRGYAAQHLRLAARPWSHTR
jgi:AraC family transcriptional regulator of adaptative response / DNA-3-methyladenine glycosylase II